MLPALVSSIPMAPVDSSLTVLLGDNEQDVWDRALVRAVYIIQAVFSYLKFLAMAQELAALGSGCIIT